MTSYKAMSKAERKAFRAKLEKGFNDLGYWFGVGCCGIWYATPFSGGKDIAFKDIFDAKRFLDNVKKDED